MVHKWTLTYSFRLVIAQIRSTMSNQYKVMRKFLSAVKVAGLDEVTLDSLLIIAQEEGATLGDIIKKYKIPRGSFIRHVQHLTGERHPPGLEKILPEDFKPLVRRDYVQADSKNSQFYLTPEGKTTLDELAKTMSQVRD